MKKEEDEEDEEEDEEDEEEDEEEEVFVMWLSIAIAISGKPVWICEDKDGIEYDPHDDIDGEEEAIRAKLEWLLCQMAEETGLAPAETLCLEGMEEKLFDDHCALVRLEGEFSLRFSAEFEKRPPNHRHRR